jgi:hypothetical protein
MSSNCVTEMVEVPSICTQVDELVRAIHARTIGKGQVTSVSHGSGASKNTVTYGDISLTELRLSLKNLLSTSAAKNCANYAVAAAQAGLIVSRMGAIGLRHESYGCGC